MYIQSFSDLVEFLWEKTKLIASLLYLMVQTVVAVTVFVASFYLWWDSRQTAQERDAISLEMYQRMSRPRYFFDPEKHLCFAYFYQERRRWYQFPTGGPTFTHVPCTQAVLDGLENRSSVPEGFVPETTSSLPQPAQP